MIEWMSALPGFAGVLVGASIGVYGLRWQHKAQLVQEIRTKGAELIFLGDQHREDSKTPTMHISSRRITDPPLPPSPAKLRAEQMRSIVRYLELTANRRTYGLAAAFQEAADQVSSNYDVDASELDERFLNSRAELVGALKAGRMGK